ncbi:YdaU family protein [Verrucomicrobium spinosum]|uniref:YdaU family protein n=1 Tax=Verrucomicrobium spinosum TaxID=2736 RepID=UPI0001744C6B|nr:DUF1376 domain-containing protein [Verrucomicrobium spinosum]
MHYYQHHVGDYNRDTAQLSVTEHGAYRLLMDAYYVSERPLPASADMLCRICRAITKAEREAVKTVARLFFREENGELRHKRIDDELEKYERKSEANRVNGAKGGRPPKRKPDENPVGSGSITQRATERDPNLNPNQEPVTKNQLIPPNPPAGGDGGAGGISPPPGKPLKPDGTSDPRHHAITQAWGPRFEEFHGFRYDFQGKDAVRLRNFLQRSREGVETFLEVAESAWARTHEDTYASASKRAATIAGLCDHWNAIRTELQARPLPVGRGNHAAEPQRASFKL